MSTSKTVALVALIAASPSLAAETPRLGQAISPKDFAAWDLSIGPDGAGLPPGKGTARRGEAIYAKKCALCHGDKGQGQPNDRLVGGHGSLTGAGPTVKTVGSVWPHATTLFDYVRRAMPLAEPQSMTADEVYAVSAYVLALNDIIGFDVVMDAKSLPKVKMPNRDSFFAVYPNSLD
ncbi:MAG: cytochrome c [Alphaproteobacteria bacterium]|nr:cytochrome c [Alphaproteobacteria bacterium]